MIFMAWSNPRKKCSETYIDYASKLQIRDKVKFRLRMLAEQGINTSRVLVLAGDRRLHLARQKRVKCGGRAL